MGILDEVAPLGGEPGKICLRVVWERRTREGGMAMSKGEDQLEGVGMQARSSN